MASHFTHVPVQGDVGPVLLQDAAGVLVDFDLPRAGHSGPFQAEIDAANTGEQAAESEWSLGLRII
ncbi:hypothetical protein AUC44_12620 [Deinococcus actinosclerus]|uniref:Uncharacterized protein n=1 Tax=Deinococcus actinosclerus TaxID=1768108 RepID=A0ABM5X794_9DEIO|nr:hypothetical protein AUC44_12620 [Deinococcus actinosclerus]